jgi:hypothetical protein
MHGQPSCSDIFAQLIVRFPWSKRSQVS